MLETFLTAESKERGTCLCHVRWSNQVGLRYVILKYISRKLRSYVTRVTMQTMSVYNKTVNSRHKSADFCNSAKDSIHRDRDM